VKIGADRQVTVNAELLESHGAAPELHPECRSVANAGVAHRPGLKTAADTVLGLLSHLKFLAIGAVGTGLLYVCSAVVVRDFERRTATENFVVVDVRRVTVPIIEPPRPAVSGQPRLNDDPLIAPKQPDSAIRPKTPVPTPPTNVTISVQ
jgi:hypothetical protein